MFQSNTDFTSFAGTVVRGYRYKHNPVYFSVINKKITYEFRSYRNFCMSRLSPYDLNSILSFTESIRLLNNCKINMSRNYCFFYK